MAQMTIDAGGTRQVTVHFNDTEPSAAERLETALAAKYPAKVVNFRCQEQGISAKRGTRYQATFDLIGPVTLTAAELVAMLHEAGIAGSEIDIG